MKALLLALLLTASVAAAEPFAQVSTGKVRIVLFTEACALKQVTNLPLRAEWTAEGKVYTGCWTRNQFGIVVMFFDDLTVISVPVQVFSSVQGT